MDAVEQAGCGHPGTPMALAPAGTILWTQVLRHDPSDPAWPDRDRFVLSCGHASMLLYGLLHLTGYDLSLNDIRAFRQWGSRTPGHPERGHTPGVETTTGPLGQGVGNAVGMAMAEALLAERFNRPGHRIVNHRTWAIASDGDLMEGVASESASLAGHLKLGKLNLIYDDNKITIDGRTDLAFSEDVADRFSAYGWHVSRVEDGNDLRAIAAALDAAQREESRPSLIVLQTVIGDPAPTKRDTSAAHGAALGQEEVARTKKILGWPEEPFHVPVAAQDFMRQAKGRGQKEHHAWNTEMESYRAAYPDLAEEFDHATHGTSPTHFDPPLPHFQAGTWLATRQASAKTLDSVSRSMTTLVGGSADLAGSTGTVLDHGGVFGPSAPGQTVHWGIREHGMAACCNGIAAHGGLRPYCSTFFVFADYMKPSIRLAALMGLPVIYLFTHDSIGVGEDGPTHQPIEQLVMLRAIPNLVTIRPADANETVQAWEVALARTDGPTALILTRQKVPVLPPPEDGAVDRGAYVVRDPETGPPRAILLGTGSEVTIALQAAEDLEQTGIPTRVVSFPSWERFAQQPESYRQSILPEGVFRVSIEAASTLGWSRWVTERGVALGLDHFGASAPADRLYREFGITSDTIVATVQRAMGSGGPS